MLSRFFIQRPIFACVIALMISGFGALSLFDMAVEQYPDIAPPTIQVTTSYPGASAEVLEQSVTQIIEQQISGIDNLLYFNSTSSSSGSVRVTLVFDQATDPDVAQMQVQNSIVQATSRLPVQVQDQGVVVRKAQTDTLLVASVYDESGRHDSVDVADFIVSQLQDPISRIDGVGETSVFGSQYAIRIWLDPHRLTAHGLTTADVVSAIEAQNSQISAGEIGAAPSVEGQALNATVTAMSLLQTPEQFERIVLLAQSGGGSVRLGDVARVERGAEDYRTRTRLNGYPASGISIQLSPGANALDTALEVKATLERLRGTFPASYKVAYPRDTTPFIEVSIRNVFSTLVEAILLVTAVMFLFLQSWRATLIPLLTIPVVLLGTFAVLAVAGFTINTLTLFGLVLAIGLLVDDAIVVVENVERRMEEDGLEPREATIRSMGDITGALVGITTVLSAVFLPMAWFGGATGTIYKQFSITLVSAMALSLFVALSLTPALCALLLRRAHPRSPRSFFGLFNRVVKGSERAYQRGLFRVLRRPLAMLAVFSVLAAAMFHLYGRLPTAFLPEEDQGMVMVRYTLPEGATLQAAERVADDISAYFQREEAENLDILLLASGRHGWMRAQNVGQAFIRLKPWSERPGYQRSAQAIIERAGRAFADYTEANVVVMSPALVSGLGQSSGFEFWLQDITATGQQALQSAQRSLIARAGEDPRLTRVRLDGLGPSPQLQVQLDHESISIHQIDVGQVNQTIATAWGGRYVNDFLDRGRVKPVYVQGDAAFRSAQEDMGEWRVRGAGGEMLPLALFASSEWILGPQMLQRFNGIPAVQIQGDASSGESSGTAMALMQSMVDELGDYQLAWSGLSYQEQLAGNQALFLYLVSIAFIFLCLAALYESWSVPAAVMLVVPLGVLGAVSAANLAGLDNDVYFQIAVLTTIGLATRNAILIVEFVSAARRQGASLALATLEGARRRLRPIVMTSLAFIAGVIPLAFAVGAGAAGQRVIGISVIGGVITGTLLTIFFVPLFYAGLLTLRRNLATRRRAGSGLD
ncbi:multidrug efflux RND transporter permease subunit [Halotalea alkalilenta]|uniref:multidrug efflux RND transporter permease subunit n=1 Tax=Halotalea alkalilenta TaxID=376489 RepID=UPI000489D16B|nr:multidrug efflux RND transporter permease subunit [Halotalea alkalilenta]